MKILHATLALFAIGVAQLSFAQNQDFGQLLVGKDVPLTVKLKDLDASWRVFKSASNSYMNMLSMFSGGDGNCYTKGATVSAAGTLFLIVYKPEGPDMSALMTMGGPPKPEALSADTSLRMSLLNLSATSELSDIHVFNLEDEISSSKKKVDAMKSAMDKVPTGPGSSDDSKPPLQKGAEAPDFTVADSEGGKVSLSNFKGKVVVVDFWATWCGPCQQSLPKTNEIAAKYKSDGVVFLAVNVWDQKDAFDDWLPSHKDLSSLTFLIDTSKSGDDVATKLYNVTGIPTQFVIGKDGKIVGSTVGSGQEGDLETALKSAIAAK